MPFDTFGLGAGQIAESPFAGRLVVAWGDASQLTLARRRAAVPATAIDPPTSLLGPGLLRLWTDFQWVTHMGPAVMVDPEPFLLALRQLSDELFMLCAPDEAPVIELVEPSVLTRAMVASLYPDATQLELDGATESAPSVEAVPRMRVPGPANVSAQLLVILGSPRSGTTWLSRLLQIHPSVGGIGDEETWLFEMLSPLWRAGTDPASLGAHVSLDDLAGAVRRFCDRLFDGALANRKPRAHVFVEKTPGHVQHLQMIKHLYPDAHFVHLVRDGRDVARSLSDMAMANHPKPHVAATMWADSLRTARQGTKGLTRVLEVRYEDLLSDPASGVARILEWVGLVVDGDARGAIGAAAGERVSTWSGVSSALGSQSWRAFSRWTLGRVYAAAGEILVSEGYLTPEELGAWRKRPEYRVAQLRELLHLA